MEYIEWDEKYSVGIDEMDTQHKKLFSISNELYEVIKAREYGDRLSDTFDSLLNYIKEHFYNEEQMLEKGHYPELESQRKAHVAFTINLVSYYYQFKNKQTSVPHELLDYLKNWLFKHIMLADKKYGNYFTARESAKKTVSTN